MAGSNTVRCVHVQGNLCTRSLPLAVPHQVLHCCRRVYEPGNAIARSPQEVSPENLQFLTMPCLCFIYCSKSSMFVRMYNSCSYLKDTEDMQCGVIC